MVEPPLFEGAVHESDTCELPAVAVKLVGEPGAVGLLVPDAFTSMATSSQRSPPPLAVQLHVAEPGEGVMVELDAPVIIFGTLMSHSCVHVGLESVFPPYIAGKSRTQLFGFAVVIDTVGLPPVALL